MGATQQETRDSTYRGRTRTRADMIVAVTAGVLTVALIIGVVLWLVGTAPGDTPAPAAGPTTSATPEDAADIDLAGLTEASTYTTVADAPADSAPQRANDGAVVHPRKTVPIYAKPDGRPIAKIKPTQLGDTWLPVIDKRAGWVKVLLPSKPNGSTGWLRDAGLDRAVTSYQIRVHLGSMRMSLYFEGRETGSWTIGIGMPSTPTPTGRTFLLGSFVDPEQDFSPIILPLGAHSPTLDTFGGGPGTVAFHTWPTDDVYGTASSNGCIRVPPDALDQLTKVPLGTLVLIDGK